MSSLSSSSRSIGAGWEYTLYFTPDAKNPTEEPEEIDHDELLTSFTNGLNDKIENVSIWKQNLSAWMPQWFGLWHEFVAIESKNYYWSFEKDTSGICVQRSKDKASVRLQYRGKKRTNVKREGRDPLDVEGDRMEDVFKWIHLNNYLNRGYNVLESNCHYFASLLFEAVSRTRGQGLDKKIKNVKHI